MCVCTVNVWQITYYELAFINMEHKSNASDTSENDSLIFHCYIYVWHHTAGGDEMPPDFLYHLPNWSAHENEHLKKKLSIQVSSINLDISVFFFSCCSSYMYVFGIVCCVFVSLVKKKFNCSGIWITFE